MRLTSFVIVLYAASAGAAAVSVDAPIIPSEDVDESMYLPVPNLSIPPEYKRSSEKRLTIEIDSDELLHEAILNPMSQFKGFTDESYEPADLDFMIDTLYPALSGGNTVIVVKKSESDPIDENISYWQRSPFLIPEPTSMTFLSIAGFSFAASRYRRRRRRLRAEASRNKEQLD